MRNLTIGVILGFLIVLFGVVAFYFFVIKPSQHHEIGSFFIHVEDAAGVSLPGIEIMIYDTNGPKDTHLVVTNDEGLANFEFPQGSIMHITFSRVAAGDQLCADVPYQMWMQDGSPPLSYVFNADMCTLRLENIKQNTDLN